MKRDVERFDAKRAAGRRGRSCRHSDRGMPAGEMALSYVHLSRMVSHALRHQPWLYQLELDQGGWTSVDALVEALRREPGWEALSVAEIEAMVAGSAKQRHEVRDGRIRASYGHSLPGRVELGRRQPPGLLFHGTSPAAASVIVAQGLRPMARQYVHLSADLGTAQAVGARKDSRPVVLEVFAADAAAAGVAFYFGNERVWLADFVPARFIARPDPG